MRLGDVAILSPTNHAFDEAEPERWHARALQRSYSTMVQTALHDCVDPNGRLSKRCWP